MRLIGFDAADERRRESAFSLGNGVLLLRSAMPWSSADGTHYPGMYHAGCYNPLESLIEGQVEFNESIVNLPNGLSLTFRLEDGDWFTLEQVEVLHYEQVLDIENGMMHRALRFRDRANRITSIDEERFVSMDEPHLVGLRLRFTPHNWSGKILCKSEIDGTVINDNVEKHTNYAHKHLQIVATGAGPDQLWLNARTINSQIDIAVRTRDFTSVVAEDAQYFEAPERVSRSFSIQVHQSKPTTIDKLMAVCAGEGEHLGEKADAILARGEGYEDARKRHQAAWRVLWEAMPITVADPPVEQAHHLTLFHLLQNYSPHSLGRDMGLPARGWQEVYRGQVFWDEMFSVPVFSIRMPELAREILLYRHARLDAAKENARKYNLCGALYPWRSARTGAEETPRFQKSTINGHWREDHTDHQVHINGSIAWNIFHYVWATGDRTFLEKQGLEMLVEICRMWASLATYDAQSDRFDIGGVVGPDEFHTQYPGHPQPGIDNNAYTNVLAAWTLSQVLQVLTAAGSDAGERLQVSEGETRLWHHISKRLRLSVAPDGRIEQFEGVEGLKQRDPDSLGDGSADWELEAQGEDVNDFQLFKQTDFAMLLYLFSVDDLQAILAALGHTVSAEQLHRGVEYYRTRTSHGSSLSQVSYAAALSHFDSEQSYSLWREALAPDLDPENAQSAAEGLHLGSMAASLEVLQRHYLGLIVGTDGLELRPHIPEEFPGVSFPFIFRGGRYRLQWDGSVLRLSADKANPDVLCVKAAGKSGQLAPGQTLTVNGPDLLPAPPQAQARAMSGSLA